MWGAFFLLGIGIVFLWTLPACLLRRSPYFLGASAIIVYISWYIYSPIYRGPISILKSTEHREESYRNWADTEVCSPTMIRVQNLSHLISSIQAHSKIRVAGGGHSWAPFVCSDTVLRLSYCSMEMIGTHVSADAGCTIKQVQAYLSSRGRQLHGYGSIQEQTLAGGLMTALHGAQFDSFASHMVSGSAVLANGSVVDADPNFWTYSMGMLGVLHRVVLQTYTLESVLVEERFITVEDIDAVLHNTSITAMTVKTMWGTSTDVYHLRTFSVPIPTETVYSTPYYAWDAFLHDNIILPALVLGSHYLRWIPVISMYYTEQTKRMPLLEAWYRYPEYGFRSSEYSVPIDNCTGFVKEMRTIAIPYIATMEVRKLHADHKCLSWVREDSCLIDTSFTDASLYLFDAHVDMYHRAVESLVASYGGRPHWGKWYASPLVNVTTACKDDFLQLRAELDPTKKFVNDYVQEWMSGTPAKRRRRLSAIAERGSRWRLLYVGGLCAMIGQYICWCKPYKGRKIRRKM